MPPPAAPFHRGNCRGLQQEVDSGTVKTSATSPDFDDGLKRLCHPCQNRRDLKAGDRFVGGKLSQHVCAGQPDLFAGLPQGAAGGVRIGVSSSFPPGKATCPGWCLRWLARFVKMTSGLDPVSSMAISTAAGRKMRPGGKVIPGFRS